MINMKATLSTGFRGNSGGSNRSNSTLERTSLAKGGASVVKPSESKKAFESGYSTVSAVPMVQTTKFSGLKEPSRFPPSYPGLSLPIAEERKDYRSEVANKGIVGLRNLGNTCYMNSILQCLARLPPLVSSISRISKSDVNSKSKLEGKLAFAFKDFVVELRNSNNHSVVNPFEIKSQIGRFSRQFSGYDQQDSSEFFRCFLDALGQELNRVRNRTSYCEMTGSTKEEVRKVADRWWNYSLSREDSIINDVFQGQLASIITCSKCKYGSISCDPFLSLNLPSPESFSRAEVEDMLEIYFKPTVLPSSYICENCKKTGCCSQKIEIFRFPQVLVLQVKRFQVNAFSRTRLNTEVRMREELSLKSFACEQGEGPKNYWLKGISHHTGTLYFGHYIAECKEETGWYCFDDSRAYNVSPPGSSSSAYLLFYVAG
jgi:ubiquitin C-terminal hydrolase